MLLVHMIISSQSVTLEVMAPYQDTDFPSVKRSNRRQSWKSTCVLDQEKAGCEVCTAALWRSQPSSCFSESTEQRREACQSLGEEWPAAAGENMEAWLPGTGFAETASRWATNVHKSKWAALVPELRL